MQTVPGSHTPASEALRRGAAALGWRHDEIPRWMDYSGGPDARHGRRRSMTETYLPRADAAGARLLTGHRVHRLVLDGDRATRAEVTTADGTGGDGRFRPRRRVRRGDPDAGPAPAFGAPPPRRPDPRRAPDGEARRPVRRCGQRSRRRPGPSGQGVRAGPLLRRLGVRTRPRRPRPQRLVAPVPRRGDRLAEHGRVLRGDHERGSRPRPGPPEDARPARHVSPAPAATAPSSAGGSPASPSPCSQRERPRSTRRTGARPSSVAAPISPRCRRRSPRRGRA